MKRTRSETRSFHSARLGSARHCVLLLFETRTPGFVIYKETSRPGHFAERRTEVYSRKRPGFFRRVSSFAFFRFFFLLDVSEKRQRYSAGTFLQMVFHNIFIAFSCSMNKKNNPSRDARKKQNTILYMGFICALVRKCKLHYRKIIENKTQIEKYNRYCNEKYVCV